MRTHFDTHNGTEYDIPKTSSSGLHHVGLQCLAASATLLCTQSVQQVQQVQEVVQEVVEIKQVQVNADSYCNTHNVSVSLYSKGYYRLHTTCMI